MHGHPVWIVKADGTGGFEVVHPERTVGIPLLGRSEGGEAKDAGVLSVQELGEAAFKVVVGGDIIEDGLRSFQGAGRQVAPPGEWLGVAEFEILAVELQRPFVHKE